MALFSSIKPLFKNKPLVIVLNKTDIKPYSEVTIEDKNLIEGVAKENNTYLIQMSNISGDGVGDVKSSACDILIDFRFANKTKTVRAVGDNVLDKIYVAQPSQARGERTRKPNIPDSVVQEKEQEAMEEQFKTEHLTEEEKRQVEDRRLRDGDVEKLEKKIKYNRIKELVEQNGGHGVFSISDREHFMLEKPEWKNDIWPEIMDGKNVFDYVDPDILKKLEKLEREEEKYLRSQNVDMDDEDDDEESSDLSEDLIEANEQVLKDVKTIRKKHELTKNSQLPRRVRGLTESEKFMQEIRSEKKEIYENMNLLAVKSTRDRKDKLRSKLIKESKKDDSEDDEEEGEDEAMDVEEDYKPTKKRKFESEEQKLEAKRREELENARKVTVQRMKNKIQKTWNRQARVNDADRQIPSKLPKHLNSGKRGIGKTDRR